MKVNSIANSSQVFQGKLNKNNKSENKENNNQEINSKEAILGGLGILGAVMAYMLISPKAPKKLAEIDFKTIKGSKFTGIIEDVLKSGDKIKLVYENGLIKESTKVSPDGTSIQKIYQYFEDGTRRVGTFEGTEKVVRHASYGKNGSTFSLIEENFEDGISKGSKELVRLVNQDAEGGFYKLEADGKIRIGTKENGKWQTTVQDLAASNIKYEAVENKDGTVIEIFAQK